MLSNDISLIALLSFFTLLPFIIAGGTCFIKFSIVLIMVRNALGIQQVPSNLTLNGVALIMTAFVMMPVCQNISLYVQKNNVDFNNSNSVNNFLENGFDSYREYLVRYSDHELIHFFDKVKKRQNNEEIIQTEDHELVNLSLMTLMPAYALSEIQSAFKIAFYLYVPFVVIDLVVSSILLALGMMMMSPITISIPIKLILFVAMNGWTLITKGMISQYTDLMTI
ncbi:EscR/YscR/HrcR family type III secretion system export apparatus protein [Erwinia tracheiphila]|uniref:EscR/YscR/HrcR family type III secretion system export apparatus protein n=1 Tax=Erwinia tracheiphila TaxID=65700 RepID=A0A0M2KI97_9GAMM|nr:EscR/YscR/HrcR family type III secretion system export apparatus protein [Erwinia tracheiphila]AXF77637.1 EscR/YscR/HrcR family type III secretion system export apparatus protein [Erwinia tracheiphila]EOS94414.1 type III secretion system protein SpaP [Erwinia tracheiphila PSU-1]KKF36741.1 type III secretion system protein [Erwinia tracheiphila]UIA83676.1 EscR/YscR/HrcR family type III secretion system export apparatus protein [Erwinia tracheiphila]UIA88076.1 EscR/YscR/HrcR family type III s